MSKIGFYTGLCWSASFILAMLSLTQPAWGFAGNFLGVLSIWVAGVQLRALQAQLPTGQELWGVRHRWHKSLQVQLLAALLCTFVQYLYFRFFDNGRMLTALTEVYTDPTYTEVLKQTMPELKPQEVLDVISQITLTDLTMNFLIANSFLAILLSLPTAFVARLKKNNTNTPNK